MSDEKHSPPQLASLLAAVPRAEKTWPKFTGLREKTLNRALSSNPNLIEQISSDTNLRVRVQAEIEKYAQLQEAHDVSIDTLLPQFAKDDNACPNPNMDWREYLSQKRDHIIEERRLADSAIGQLAALAGSALIGAIGGKIIHDTTKLAPGMHNLATYGGGIVIGLLALGVIMLTKRPSELKSEIVTAEQMKTEINTDRATPNQNFIKKS